MDRIIDIHSHILPGIDDGSRSKEESIRIIEYLKSVGITDIVATSHYIKDTKYIANTKTRTKLLTELEKEVDGVNLYIGNEVFLNDSIIDLFETHEIDTINNTSYMLVELPLASYMHGFSNILCELADYGIVPIIAHPERYSFIQKDKKQIKKLLEFNAVLQINIESLIGKYGKKAKKVAKWLLKKDLVSAVATDVHRVGNKENLEKAYRKLKKIVGEKKYTDLTFNNPRRILANKKVKRNLSYFR